MSNRDLTNSPNGVGGSAQQTGSDFDPNLFTPEENLEFANLLSRLRIFESAVCRQFRKLEQDFTEITNRFPRPNATERIGELENSLIELENREEMDHFQTEEQVIKINEMVEGISLRLTSFENLTKVKINKMVKKLESEVRKITGDLDILRARVELLEYDGASDESQEWGGNGHEFEHEQLPAEDENPNEVESCEIMVSDPFLGGIAPMEKYDGNPSVSFSRWASKLEDMLSLYPQLTDAQQLSRLRILLSGQARAELELMDPQPGNLNAALILLKRKFENENTRSIARQSLAICRQAPGERVYEFANRLNEAIRTALAEESEQTIRKRLLEEFMERLIPELQFEVKAGRPATYSSAYELAQHFELLLASRRSSQISVVDSVTELTTKVEALALRQHKEVDNQRGAERRLCYYCRRPGHVVRDCKTKKRDERENYRGERMGGRYYGNEPWKRGGYQRENPRFTPRENERGQRNERNWGQRNEGNWGRRNDGNYRRPQNHDEQSGGYNSRSQSPARRVRFGGTFAAARIASPILMALIVLLSLFATNAAATSGVSPMICLPDAPSSLWAIPTDPYCPTWTPTEFPVMALLTIFRPNTIQYKTEATACKCIKTKISRRIGFFGGRYEEINTSTEEVPTATCRQMKELHQSPEGELYPINGTFRATNNSLEIGWKGWPAGLFWSNTDVTNCYTFDTVVFTRFGLPGVSTPMGDCSACVYQLGNCRCPQLSLTWQPDQTQQCAYISMHTWRGEYSTKIWTAVYGDFALTFANAPEKTDCEGREFILSDQSFAIPKHEYEMMINESKNANAKGRIKKEVGLVYSSQLSAQLTALSVKIAQNTQRLFTETVRQICASLQFLADQMLALAEANPTLLARFYLGNPYLSARLVTKGMLEVKPCFAILERDMHFNWQRGQCFEQLPVTFHLYGKTKHGFLDPNTLIIHPRAKEMDCEQVKYLYVSIKGRISQYDQITGEIKQIPSESLHQLSRHAKIDFPEFPVQLFKNKVMANLTELYSPEHFRETIEVAKVMQEIGRMSRPNAWESLSERSDQMAANIVSSGLFSFLSGGLFTVNQMWVFICCCYVTLTILIQFLLPQRIAQAIQYLGLIGPFLNILQNARTARRGVNGTARQPGNDVNQEILQLKPILRTQRIPNRIKNPIPLTARWPSPVQSTSQPEDQFQREREQKAVRKTVSIASAESNTCDINYRIGGVANGKDVTFLLDTGAHVSLCSVQTAGKLKMNELKAANISGVIGVSGKIVPILGQCEIEIRIAECIVKTGVCIAEAEIGGGGSYDLILGRNTFRQLPLFLDLQTGVLIRKGDGKTFICEEAGERKIFFCENAEGKAEWGGDEQTRLGLANCLEKHKNAFSSHEYDLGDCAYPAPPILTTSEIPARVKPYPVPEKYEKELKMQLSKMLEAGVIRESCTPWAHNIVLVKKTNGQLRPCVDFRPLNKITVPDPYPIPRMDKTILRAAGKKWYSSLDLASGFWQIPLDKESSHKCGIVTPWGLYQMLKLPFGLRNAPSIFQRVMDKVLEGVPNVTVYIDDILIHTNTVKDHLETLEEIFDKIKANGLKLKMEKCVFLKKECTYLGHILSESGYRPSLNNREVIIAYPEPRNVKEIKRFLGMMSFFRKFIPNFAALAHPLNQLTRKMSLEFTWTEKEKEAFGKLKEQLLKAPCLRAPNYNLPFFLFTDASAVAYAGALMQAQNGKEMHAVGYWSRTLTPTESKLPPTHGELAAIVHAVQNFRPIIYGAELTILTDHRPLTFLFSKASSNPKLNRWLMSLQEFEPQVIYVEGKANKVADALSRVPIEWGQIEGKCKEDIPFLLVTEEENGITRETVEKETVLDPLLSQVISKIKENWIEPIGEELEPYQRKRDQLYLEGNVIRKKPLRQIVIPGKMRNTVLKVIHRAHFGMVKNKARARNQIWWPGIGKDVEDFVKECTICQRNGPNPPRAEPEYKWPEAKFPFERVHADLAGPVWGTNFLIIVDAHSKFPFVHQMNSTHSSALINSFREIFGIFGSPRVLVTDNGTPFTSGEMETFLLEEGVRHITTPTYHPASNGEAERFVRTFKEGVGKVMEEGKSLKMAQFIFLQEYRASPCPAANGQSPAQKFLGKEIRTALDKIKMSTQTLGRRRQGASVPAGPEEIGGRALVQKRHFDPGDLVWIKEPDGKWSPGVVLQPIGDRMWEVELEGSTTSKRAHLDQIKARRPATARHN